MDRLNDVLASNNPSHIQSIKRAVVIIELLASERKDISLTEISRILEWPKSTVHGILSTLRDFSYIEQSPETGHYRLGVRFFELGNLVSRRFSIGEIARPVLKKVNETFGETVQLGVENRGHVLYLEKIESNSLIHMVSHVGTRLPMHCSGLGKVLLAYMPKAKVSSIIKIHGLKKFTTQTITTEKELTAELEKIREHGFGYDNNETMEGLRCIAFPVFDENKNVPCAISISAISNHMTKQRLEEARILLDEASKEISALLAANFQKGYRE